MDWLGFEPMVRQQPLPKVDDAWYGPGLQRAIPALLLAMLLTATSLGILLTGGAGSPLVPLACLPIVCAALLYRLPGGLLSAAALGLATSPLLVTSSQGVPTGSGWLYRLGIFACIGALSGGLVDFFKHRDGNAGGRGLSETATAMLRSLAQIVEGRDERAGGHCDRVAQNAVLVGRQLGFCGKDLETLYWGAMLHDLGKIAIPERVLLKPAKLTADEYAEVKHHPDYGADLLRAMSSEFDAIAKVVRYHHERWDGAGYPSGLRGEQIPLMSRIVTLADVFEALTSERPYRRPMAPAPAIAYLTSEAGDHFDPLLVGLFEELFRQGEIRVAGDILLTDTLEVPAAGAADHPNWA